MTILQAWGQSLLLLKPSNLQALLLEGRKSVRYGEFFKHHWFILGVWLCIYAVQVYKAVTIVLPVPTGAAKEGLAESFAVWVYYLSLSLIGFLIMCLFAVRIYAPRDIRVSRVWMCSLLGFVLLLVASLVSLIPRIGVSYILARYSSYIFYILSPGFVELKLCPIDVRGFNTFFAFTSMPLLSFFLFWIVSLLHGKRRWMPDALWVWAASYPFCAVMHSFFVWMVTGGLCAAAYAVTLLEAKGVIGRGFVGAALDFSLFYILCIVFIPMCVATWAQVYKRFS